MRYQSSRPSPEQDVSKNEPKQPSSISSVSGGAGSAAANKKIKGEDSIFKDWHTVVGTASFLKNADEKQQLAMTSKHLTNVMYGDPRDSISHRKKKITSKLVHAVAYGMESRDVNVDPKPNDLFAKDLLKESPEFLLERTHFTDWGGRTFKGRITEKHPEGEGITAFEYALWAKDFKMLEMMLNCIPDGEAGAAIRMELLRQYEQVTKPGQGGGLTYTHTYEHPKVDKAGIPIKNTSGNWDCETVTWDCETVTEERVDENHFDITPLLNAYKDYDTHFDARTWAQRHAYWIKIIGTQQRLLPIHILQRYCDPDTPFDPTPPFTGAFKRTTQFLNHRRGAIMSLLSSSLSSDLAVARAWLPSGCRGGDCGIGWRGRADVAGARQVDKVSTSEIETKIKPLLTAPAQSQTQFRY